MYSYFRPASACAIYHLPSTIYLLDRVKLHAKSTEARNAETKIREAYAQIDEAGRALRSATDGGAAVDAGVSGIGSAENR